MRSFLTSILVVSSAFPLAAQTGVVNHKLSGPMPTGTVGDVGDLVISPSGGRVLYQVSLSTEVVGPADGSTRLEVAFTDGSAVPTALSPFERELFSLRWTPDESRAVFIVRRSDGRYELQSVLTDGSAPPTSLFALAAGETLAGGTFDFDESFQLTPDGTRVIYLLADSIFSTSTVQLYSVPVDGSAAPVRLNGTLAGNGDVTGFLATDSTVVYLADQVNSWFELYSVPVDGSAAPINLSDISASSESVIEGFAVVPDGTRAVYMARPGGPQRVFSVLVDGSAPAVLLSPDVTSFEVSPSGADVLYRSDQDGEFELFLAPIDGSASAEKLVAVDAGGSVDEGYLFSPDGAYVVYEADPGGVDPDGFFSARVSDGAIAALHPANIRSYRFSPDSTRVAFMVFSDSSAIHSAPVDGATASVQLTPDFVAGGQVDVFASTFGDGYVVTPDSLRVVYRADADTDEVDELYRVEIVPSGSPVATKLNPVLPPGADVERFRVAPSSTFVVYGADATTFGITELLRAPGSFALNDPLPTGTIGDVGSDFVVRNGRVAYLADEEVDSRTELFGVPSDASAPSVKLSGNLVSGGRVDSVSLSPDGSTAVYIADAEVDQRYELFSVPSDGSAAPVKLNGVLALNDVSGSRISPDGTRVVYEANLVSAPGKRLHSVPIHGGASVAISAGINSEFEITSDSSRVVFEHVGLDSAPIDGSAAPVDLSGALTSIGDFATTPDGSRVVFLATTSGTTRLYSNSILGGAPIDLSGTLVAGGDVEEFAISVDGERVVFRSDRFVDERFLLFSVPIDGSSGPLVLNGGMVAQGDVTAFALSPDGVNVVYMADQELDESERLHRAPVDGSAPAVMLSEVDLDSADFVIAPDGAHIVVSFDGLQALPIAGGSFVQVSSTSSAFAFAANGRRVVHNESGQLVLTPIGGGVSVPLSPVSGSPFTLDGARVVYRAHQDAPGVEELYVSWLDLRPAQHAPPSQSRSVTR